MRIRRIISRTIINSFFCGTRFFRIKSALLKFGGIKCGKNVRLVGPIDIGNVSALEIGNNVWIGKRISIHGNGKVILEDNIDIAPEVSFITGSHEISDDPCHRAGKGISYVVKIGSGCWIGSRVTVMGNTTIGNGVVVGACSYVNKSLPDNVVAFGVPAKSHREL